MARRTRPLLLLILVGIGAALRFWGIGFGLPLDLARPDEEKLIGAAVGIAHGALNPHLFLYPTLFIYLIAAAYKLVWLVRPASDISTLHLVPRVLAATFGVATIPALYGAVSELFSKRAAMIAAAFLAVAFLHVRDSHFGTTDVPVTFLIVCAFWAAARWATRGVTARRVALAGVLCGLAASTKYNAAVVALPTAVAIAGDFRTQRSIRRGAALIALLGVCLVAAFLAGTPYALLDRAAFAKELRQQSLTAAGVQQGDILTPARAIVGERGWKHHFTFSLRHGVGEALLAAGVFGAVWLFAQATLASALVLSFPLIFYAAMGMSELVYPRWIVPVVPFVCLTAAFAIDRGADLFERFTANIRLIAPAVVALVGVIAAPTLARAVAFDRVVSQTDTRVLASRWIEEHYPAGATVYQTGSFYGFVEPQPSARYTMYGFDEVHARFTREKRPVNRMPDIVVVAHSPLAIFSGVPDAIPDIVEEQCELAQTFRAIRADRPFNAVYDQQDAFYVPFAGLTSVRRPGPDLLIYVRR